MTIASLDLLGVLVGVMVLMLEVGDPGESPGSISLTCGTDNQGNMYLMDKLLTTKHPFGVVLMELSTQLGRRGATLRADRIPRLQNEEADALTDADLMWVVAPGMGCEDEAVLEALNAASDLSLLTVLCSGDERSVRHAERKDVVLQRLAWYDLKLQQYGDCPQLEDFLPLSFASGFEFIQQTHHLVRAFLASLRSTEF